MAPRRVLLGYAPAAALLLLAAYNQPPAAFSPASRLLGLLRRHAPKLPAPRRFPRTSAAAAEEPLKDMSTMNGATLPTDMLEPPAPQKAMMNQTSPPLEKATMAKEAFKAEVKEAKAKGASSSTGRAAPPEAAPVDSTPAEEEGPGAAVSGFLKGIPGWAPFAAVVGSVGPRLELASGLAALVGLLIYAGVSLTSPAPAPAPAVRPAPAPTVVQVKPAAPVPAPAPVPVTPPAAKPPAPAPKAPAAAAPQGAPGSNWGRRFANWVSAGLRKAADEVPSAELALEKELPAAQSGVQWALEIRPENAAKKAGEAMPVVGKALASGAEVAARSGLQLGASGLNFVNQELPEAGQVLQGVAVKALPSLQSVTRAAADGARTAGDTATGLAKPGALPKRVPQEVSQVLGKAEPVLDTTAAALDAAADAAPTAEAFLNYVAGKAMPIARAALSAVAEVAVDASKLPPPNVPLPEASQVKGTLKELGVDTDAVATSAQKQALSAWQEATKQLPDPGTLLSKTLDGLLSEPAPTASTPAPSPTKPKTRTRLQSPPPTFEQEKPKPQPAVKPTPAPQPAPQPVPPAPVAVAPAVEMATKPALAVPEASKPAPAVSEPTTPAPVASQTTP